MIADLDETIKQLLIKKGGLDPTEVDIVFDMPDREWSATISKPTVNFYLYDINENLELRDYDWNIAHSNGQATRTKLPIRIDLAYLVTVWTNEIADQHRLLGHILATLLRHHEMPEEMLQGSLAGIDFPIKTKAAQPDGFLRNASDFWSALDNNLRPSISYAVTIPIDLDISLTATEVKTKAFKFRDDTGKEMGDMLQISGVVHRKGKPEEGVPNVLVFAREAQATATTDESGNYAFRNLSARNYTFEISVDGEKKSQVEIVVPSPSYDIEL